MSKIASFQILSIHEGASHWGSGFYTYKYQNKELFEKIKFDKKFFDNNKINDNKQREYLKLDEGDIFEILLFSRKIDNFTVKEILFLLNRNSYDTDFKTFNKKFNSLNETNYDLYFESSKNIHLKNLLNYLNINESNFQNIITPISRIKRDGQIINCICSRDFNIK